MPITEQQSLAANMLLIGNVLQITVFYFAVVMQK